MTTQNLSEISKDEQLKIFMDRMDKQQEAIDKLTANNILLTKAANKQRLNRFSPKEDEGTSITVSTYRKDFEDEARLVTNWQLIKDDVRTNDKTGIEEDQRVLITLFDDGAIQDMQDKLANTDYSKRPDIKEKLEKDLKDLQKKFQIELTYKDFALTPLMKQERVQVKGFEEDIGGDKKVKFDYNGMEHRLNIALINK